MNKFEGKKTAGEINKEEPATSERYFDREQFRELHNQKTGDFDPETGRLYDQKSAEYDKVRVYKEKERVEKSVGEGGKLEKRIREVISTLDGLKLQPEAQNDEIQKKLLTEKVKMSKTLIKDVLNSAKEYNDSIKGMGEVKLNKEVDDFKDRLAESDGFRKIKHDKLIDSINIANRYLRNFFGKLEDMQLAKFEENETRNKRPVVKVERVAWSKNILLPDNLDLSKREQVMDWSIAIEDELVKIEKNPLSQ